MALGRGMAEAARLDPRELCITKYGIRKFFGHGRSEEAARRHFLVTTTDKGHCGPDKRSQRFDRIFRALIREGGIKAHGSKNSYKAA